MNTILGRVPRESGGFVDSVVVPRCTEEFSDADSIQQPPVQPGMASLRVQQLRQPLLSRREIED